MPNKKNTISILALAICTVSNLVAAKDTDRRTFAGTKLELVLAADNGETTLNNLESLTADERDEVAGNFRVVRLHGRTLLGEGFYLIGNEGTIEKFVTVDEYRDVILPSKNGDCYLVCSGSCPTAFHSPYFPSLKTLYDTEGIKKWSHEVYGYVHASEDLSLIGVFFPFSRSERNPNIRIIDKNGNLKDNHQPYCGAPYFVSRDGEKIIVPEFSGSLPAQAPKGTRVFGRNGRLMFTLDPGYLCYFGAGDGPKLYCSDRLIVQICQEVERQEIPPHASDPEKRPREKKVEKPGYYIQVYSEDGVLMWQKPYRENTYFGSFAFSGNDRFLLVYVPGDLPRYEVFEVETGVLKSAIPMPEEKNWRFVNGTLSNDGKRQCLILVKTSGVPGDYSARSKAAIFDDGIKIAEFNKSFNFADVSTGGYHVEFSDGGRYVSVSSDKSFRIYRIEGAR